LADLRTIQLDPALGSPLYRQLAEAVTSLIIGGKLRSGDRLPPTRELAGQLGLNRTTVSAAYALLEQAGLLEGQVGRGSFVAQRIAPINQENTISFASSRPSQSDFPLAQFRRLAKEVIDAEGAADILQLGSAHGYAPLRRYLLERAIATGVALSTDGLIITNGCQQALDLLARLHGAGASVVLEDPAYHGAVRVFAQAGAEIIAAPLDEAGLDMRALEPILDRRRPRLLVVTPSFQNPTGTTLPIERRRQIVALANQYGCTIVENDVYSELRYSGEDLPTLKQLDSSGNTILLRSYSKVAFPGLRVGWMIAPRPVIARVAEVKEISDLHSDQLSQAVLLRFAESGELERHLERTRCAGAERLQALLRACGEWLPDGSRWTKPEGGMNLWLELPVSLDAERLLPKAQEAGLTFTPGRNFSINHAHGNALRISFGGLSTAAIERGMSILGQVARRELETLKASAAPENDFEPAAALV
jgi:2-aminoadipate transaminase